MSLLSLARPPCDDGVVRGAPDVAGCAERAKPWVLAATILGSSMAFIDGSVVNIALPAIQGDLAASVAGLQWVVNAYMLLLGALILVGGAAGDRYGRRRMFVTGIAVFALASAACGLAPDLATLVAARAAQGIGGALLVPASLAIISASFPEAERGRAIGTWAGFSALTTALGPVLGGWLIDAWSWRMIFFINVPVALAAAALAYARVPESRAANADGSIDWRGGALATLGLGAVAYGLTAASESGWDDGRVLGALAIGAIVLALFARSEMRQPAPMVPLQLFRSPVFSGANAMTLLLYFALSGGLFFVPFNLIQVQGYSAAAAGAAFLPFTLIMGTLSRWSGGLVERYGARAPLTLGPIVTAAGFAALAAPGIGGSYWTTFFPGMVVLGVGMAISVAPLTTTVMGSVPDRHAGAASGINNAVARIAGMLAVALLGAVAVGIFSWALANRLTDFDLPPDLRESLLNQAARLAEAEVPADVVGTTRDRLADVLDDVFVFTFRLTMYAAAAMALASAGVAWLTVAPARSDSVG